MRERERERERESKCVENEGETPCNYKLLNTELPYHRLINSHDVKDDYFTRSL